MDRRSTLVYAGATNKYGLFCGEPFLFNRNGTTRPNPLTRRNCFGCDKRQLPVAATGAKFLLYFQNENAYIWKCKRLTELSRSEQPRGGS